MEKPTDDQQLNRDAKVARFCRGLIGVILLPVGYIIGEMWQLAAFATL